MALFFFMMVFMDTTATIPTGAMAERWAWKNFCLFGLRVALPYCPGSGVTAGSPRAVSTGGWGMEQWTLPAQEWCTPWVASLRSQAP
jgi:Amt family ammonium transporter